MKVRVTRVLEYEGDAAVLAEVLTMNWVKGPMLKAFQHFVVREKSVVFEMVKEGGVATEGGVGIVEPPVAA